MVGHGDNPPPPPPPRLLLALRLLHRSLLETEFTNDEVTASTYPLDLWHCSWALAGTNGQAVAVGTAASASAAQEQACTHASQMHRDV